MKNISVSICITTFNVEPYLQKALDSALMQKTDFPIKIIIGDDVSTDSTRDIILKYKNKYPEIIVPLFNEKNLKYGPNTLNVLQYCKESTYTAFLDGDDFWTDELKLQKQIDILEKHQECVACLHLCNIEKDETIIEADFPKHEKTILEEEDLFWLESNFPSSSLVIRSSLIEKLPQKISETQGIDWAIDLTLGQFGKYYFLKENMSVYRQRSGSIFSDTDAVRKMKIKLRDLLILYRIPISNGKWSKIFRNKIGYWSFRLATWAKENKDSCFNEYFKIFLKYGFFTYKFRFFNNLFGYLLFPRFFAFLKRIKN